MERSIVINEDKQKIFARNYHVDTRANNLERDLADFIVSLGAIKGKNMINPMRVANRVAVLCGKVNPFVAAVDIIRHPDDWRFKAVRSAEDQLILDASKAPSKASKDSISQDISSEGV